MLFGGEENEDSRFIGPTFLTKVSASAAIRNEEIFGPLVSVILYKNIDDVYNYWYSKPIPLAAYYYSGSRKAKDVFRNSIQAGSTCINDCKLQFAHDELPFGGQNSSGIGKAHGEAGFLEFTNLKSEVTNKRGLTLAKQIYPPYHKKFKAHIVKNMIRWF